MKLPDDILTRIQESVQVRRSPLDSNFNFIHQEDVFIIAQLAFQRGKEYAAEELGTIDKQTTNSRVMPCPFHNTTDKTCYLVLHNGCKDSACLISAARA